MCYAVGWILPPETLVKACFDIAVIRTQSTQWLETLHKYITTLLAVLGCFAFYWSSLSEHLPDILDREHDDVVTIGNSQESRQYKPYDIGLLYSIISKAMNEAQDS